MLCYPCGASQSRLRPGGEYGSDAREVSSCCGHELIPSGWAHASRGRQLRTFPSSCSMTTTQCVPGVWRAGEFDRAQLAVDRLAWLKLHFSSLLARPVDILVGGGSWHRSHAADSTPNMAHTGACLHVSHTCHNLALYLARDMFWWGL
jgi:hypothetical protein